MDSLFQGNDISKLKLLSRDFRFIRNDRRELKLLIGKVLANTTYSEWIPFFKGMTVELLVFVYRLTITW
jgi:hypothetical protein